MLCISPSHQTHRRRGGLLLAAGLTLMVIAAAIAVPLLTSSETGPGRRGPGPRPGKPSPAPEQRLFAANSVWNAPIAKDAPLDDSSDARVKALAAEIDSKEAQPAIAGDEYSTPIYSVPRDQKRVNVDLPEAGAYGDPLRRALADGVPIPSNARAAAGTDGHMTVYQPSTDTLWEFWRAKKVGGKWQASWGGAMQDVSKSPGYFSNESWPELTDSQGWNWGSTATSIPVAAGVMKPAELESGDIPHALAAAVPDACKEVIVKPASRADGTDSSPDCMPEGARLQLDPSIDVGSLGLSPVTEAVAKAAQRYGIVIRDVTRGGSVSMYAESPKGAKSPYGEKDGPFKGLAPYETLKDFPWDKLQMLKAEPCEAPAPCTSG